MAGLFDRRNKEKTKREKIDKTTLKKALKIFRFLRPYRYTFILGNVFLILSTLTVLATPYLAGKLLDVALGNKSAYFNSIMQVSLIFGVILLFQAIFSFLRVYLFAVVSEKTMADIRQTLYTKILTLSITFFEKRRVGELNSRITSDITQLQDVLSFTSAEFFRQVCTILIGTGVLFFLSVKLTFFMLATFPITILLAAFFGRFIRKLSKKSQDALAESNTIVEETLQAIQSVKAFTNEIFEIKRYSKSLSEVVSLSIKGAKYRGAFLAFVITVIFGGILGVMIFAGFLVENQDMTAGELVSYIMFTMFIGGSVGGTIDMYAKILRSIGASERILEILDERSEVELGASTSTLQAPIQGKVIFENVAFAYPTRKDVEVLKGICFKVKTGQKIALVGHSGAGKSTIIQLLNRYYDLKSGSILIDNQNISEYNITFLRQNIGMVPQEVILFGGTIRENIAYGRTMASEEEIKSAALQANAWEFIKGFPEGLDTLVGERGVKLSGGQRQRIAIARAILKNPAILVLDEATSSLDADSERLVQDALEKLMKNRTTIIIAHRLATIRSVDKIFVIDKGKIKEEGTHAELSLVENGIYSNLVKLQFEQGVGVD